ncbi:MAG: phenylalanine--tRNA ligase subunit alpha [Lentisphaerae bacterium]|nr:MAG: phenylalanine--tRNA ligase subunit alpha [Lentisphaerota bacterium]
MDKAVFLNELQTARDEAFNATQSAENLQQLEEARARFIGRKGKLPALMKHMGQLDPQDRPEIGKILNQIKREYDELLKNKKAVLSATSSAKKSNFDPTLPGRLRRLGHKHPISQVIDDCCAIFRRMGFIVVDGPDIEDEYHNFDALNTPADHPSRDLHDTFYLPGGFLLRTQTSTVQIRTMEKQDPPIRIVAPGRCYRKDTLDATHSMNFSQIEGLYVDRKVSLADLKSTLLTFAREMFGKDVQIRLRPHFFPFTEPSIECDVLFRNFKGQGDRWLEIAGAGMVDPNVLQNVGYDPEQWTGYAFGMGIERIAMLKYDIPDIRFLYDNYLGFLHQF